MISVAGVTIENQNRNIFGKVAFFQVTEKDSVRILGSLSGLSPGTNKEIKEIHNTYIILSEKKIYI